MINNYLKKQNETIKKQFTDGIIKDVQSDLSHTAKMLNSNIYDMVKNLNISNCDDNNVDLNVLLKYYILNQIIKDAANNIEDDEENLFEDTPNNNIKIHIKDNKFYKVKNEQLSLAEEIQSVNEDGSYIVIEKRTISGYKVKKIYNTYDQVESIQLLTTSDRIETNRWQVAEILEMKKEYVYQHKYNGYCGESSDLVASLLNKLSAPVESGYYMDKTCQLYKWSELKKCFIRKADEFNSPLLTDYDFSKNNIVIRKEYSGKK